MFGERKRLFVLIGAAVAVVAIYLLLHGVPWGGSDYANDPAVGAGDGLSSNDTGDANVGSPSPRGGGSDGGSETASYVRISRIAERPKPIHLPELKKAAKSPEPRVREVAVVGMGRLGTDSDPKALIEALQTDKSAPVRIAAATALGRLKCWEAGPALIEALDDTDSRVRSRAGIALTQIMGVDFGYRANATDRLQTIQKIRDWWPQFYKGHLDREGREG